MNLILKYIYKFICYYYSFNYTIWSSYLTIIFSNFFKILLNSFSFKYFIKFLILELLLLRKSVKVIFEKSKN